jgi:FAD/FMN-containing dehydrogenase
MRRRDFLAAVGAAGAAVALPGCTVEAGPRPAPGGITATRAAAAPTAPGPRAWRALAEDLDGSLLRPGQRRFAAASRLYNPRFDDVVPTAVVRAANAHDVAETVRFARRHDLRLRLRSGGHSYVGASTGSGAIQLDLSGMNRVTVPAGEHRVRVQAGARLFDVHHRLDGVGRTLPTGTCPTVGVAGLTLGGGIGVESRMYGLTCDALEELVVVRADGRVLHADADRHADLLWASRGGGGGSVAVVTEMTFRTFPQHPMGFFFLHFAAGDAEHVLRGWHRRVPAMPRSAWANVHVDAQQDGEVAVRVVGVSFTGDGHAEADAMTAAIGRPVTRAAFLDLSHHDGVRLLAGCSDLSDADCAPAPAGSLGRECFVAGGDVLAARVRPDRLDAAVVHVRRRAAAGRAGTLIVDPLGGRVARLQPGATAFRWRGAGAVAQWYVPLPDRPRDAATAAAYRWVRGGHRAFGDASVGGYVNYLEPGRPLSAYYGPNFARLRAVKARYDPDDLLRSRYAVPLP